MPERKTGKPYVPAGVAEPQPTGRGRRMLSFTAKFIAPVLVLAAAGVSFVGLKATKPDVPQKPVSEKVWPVTAKTAKVADFQPDIRLFGNAISGRRVELRALVAGEITDIGDRFRDGGVVNKDELLLRVDKFEYEGALVEAEANLAEARARYAEIEATIENEQDALKRTKEQLSLARRDLERALPLAQRGTVSKKTADDRKVIVSEREQAVEQRANNVAIQQARANQQLAIIARSEWRVRQAKKALEDTELEAPFDAYISQVNAEVGRMVGANDQVATLLDQDWIEVRFTLTNSQYGRIVSREGGVRGRTVRVLWHIGDAPIEYSATIERVAPEINPETGGVDVFARIVDPKNPVPIRPGAFVEVLMQDRVYPNVVRLPQTSLYGGNTVYVVEADRLALRKVNLVGASGTEILVRGDLKEGDHVVTTRLSTAEPGLRVREQ